MKKITPLLKLLVSGLIFFFIFSKTDFHKTQSAIQSMDLRYFAAALAAAFAGNVCASATTAEILKMAGILMKFREVLKVNYFSYFFSSANVMAGGLLRWHLFSKTDKKRLEAALVIFMERLESVWIFGLFFATIVWVPSEAFSEKEKGIFLIFGILLAAVVLLSLVLIFFIPPRLLGKNTAAIVEHVRTRKERVFSSTLCLMFSFLCGYAVFILTSASLGIPLGLETLWVYAMTGAAVMVPITIFGLGVREGLLVYLLLKFGVPAETSLAIGVLIFFTIILQALLGGVWYLKETLWRKKA